ncbi:hypothetical protein GC175_23940 [bacterium]|nr:hypothetical protein [bacterium]
MKTRKNLFIFMAVVALSLVAFVGSAFAQDTTPTDDATQEGNLPQMQQHMEERFGEGAWAEMIARMTERHGAEFTAERLQWMDENGCPMLEDGEHNGPMMRGHMWDGGEGTLQNFGRSMMHRFFGSEESDTEFTPGQGMMGRGMMHNEEMSQHHMGSRGMWGNGR